MIEQKILCNSKIGLVCPAQIVWPFFVTEKINQSELYLYDDYILTATLCDQINSATCPQGKFRQGCIVHLLKKAGDDCYNPGGGQISRSLIICRCS